MTGSPAPVSYTCAGPALVRIPLAPVDGHRPTGEPAAKPPTAGQLRARVADLLRDEVLREAVELASPSTASICRRSLEQLPDKRLRTLAATLTAYAARMRSRATPFGLFAGVTLAPFAETVRGRVADPIRHRRDVRPDAGWLRDIVRGVEHSQAGTQVLKYARNPAVILHEGAYHLHNPDEHTSRLTFRTTPVLTAVLRAASAYTSGQVLAEAACAAGTAPEDGARLVRRLVAGRFLVSELQPPAHHEAPLDHVIRCLRGRRILPDLVTLLEEFAAAAQDYAATAPGGPMMSLEAVREAAARATTAVAMPDAKATEGLVLHVDTVLDADIALSAAVRAEAEDAARILARFAGAREKQHVQAYLRETAGEFGLPLAEVALPPLPAAPGAARPALLTAYAAALHGQRTEIVLDNALLDAIAPVADASPPPDLDLFAVVAASDLAALRDGVFELHIRRPAASGAGTALARFTPGLGEAGHQALCGIREAADRAALDRLTGPAAIADLTFQPRQPAAENVARTRLTRPLRILTNTPAVDAGGGVRQLAAHDLVLVAGPDGPQIWSRSLNSQIVPRAATTLNTQTTGPRTAHVLAAACGENLGFGFDWGELRQAPWLPRVRRGRTVFSPQTWRPPEGLLGEHANSPSWYERFAAWREEWSVPREATLVQGDRQVHLRLDDPVDLQFLRRQAQKASIVLTEALGREHCWARSLSGPHLVEAVFPMIATAAVPSGGHSADSPSMPALRPPLPDPAPPGSDWVRALLPYGRAHRTDVVRALARALEGNRWFFTQSDPGFLDVVVHLNRAAGNSWDDALPRLIAQLPDARSASEVVLRSYRRDAGAGTPQAHPEQMEHWAVADTLCALAALEDSTPAALLMSLLDLAGQAAGPDGRSPLADVEPDRRSFAALRRRVLPVLAGQEVTPGDLTFHWQTRARRTRCLLDRLESPAAFTRAGHLLLRQHACRLAGPQGAGPLLATAAAAQLAVNSWRRATGSAA